MITYKEGFLPLDGSVKNIVHCIAEDRACGAGFAKQIPAEHLKQLRADSFVATGDYHLTRIDGFDIVHLVTKMRSSDKPTREDFTEALLRFVADYINTEWNCPMMGSGLDQLSWTETAELLEALPINFIVWVPNPKDNPIAVTK